jgi:hypothetical protein
MKTDLNTAEVRLQRMRDRLVEIEIALADLQDGTKLIPALNAINEAIKEQNLGVARKLIFDLIAEVTASKYV